MDKRKVKRSMAWRCEQWIMDGRMWKHMRSGGEIYELFIFANVWANGRALEGGCEWMSEVEERRRRGKDHFRVQSIRRVILMDAEVTQRDGQPRGRL